MTRNRECGLTEEQEKIMTLLVSSVNKQSIQKLVKKVHVYTSQPPGLYNTTEEVGVCEAYIGEKQCKNINSFKPTETVRDAPGACALGRTCKNGSKINRRNGILPDVLNSKTD